ncbi:MAG: hypothetical protein KAR56_02180 [Thermoplasmata archaeon]|nr:hypothetical protein [Thermoplasmata archaeon]
MANSNKSGKKIYRGFRNNLNISNAGTSRDGLTNGNGSKPTDGLTNGMGSSNGYGPSRSLKRIDDKAISPKKLSLVLVLTIVLLIPSIFIAFNYSEPVEDLKIDGIFDDIDTILLIADDETVSTPALDIEEYGIAAKGDGFTYLYARAKGNWMDSAEANCLNIFFDSDNDKSTGYKLENMGADYLIEVYGWDGNVQGQSLKTFSGDDQYNWSSGQSLGFVRAAMSGNQIEIAVSHNWFTLEDDYKALFTTKSEANTGEICKAQIAEGTGALVVRQEPNDVNGIISGNTAMNLELRAYGYDIEVSLIGLTGLNSASVSGLPVTVPADSSITLNVDVSINNLAQGSFVGLSVSSVICNGSYSITGEGLKAYATAAPTEILIDGAFADWNSVNKSTDGSDPDNSDIDITEYASVNTTSSALFYMKTDSNGNIFAGGITPYTRTKPESSGSTGEPTTPKLLPRKTGEDITRIYVDTQDGGQNTGGIFADYLIEITGIHGEITSSKLYSLPGKHFVKVINAANGVRELEASVDVGDINYTGTMQFYFETTDWQKNKDTTPSISMTRALSFGTRSGGDLPEVTGDADLMDAPYTSSAPTIDGDWSSSEWTDADSYNDGTNLIVYTMQDGTNLYVCVRVQTDTTDATGDYCDVMFERCHSGESSLDSNDRKFRAEDSGVSDASEDYDGTGGTWTVGSLTGWSAVAELDASDSSYITYEFQIPFIDVWGTSTPSSGDIAGFAIQVYDADSASTYEYGSASVDELNPSTWDDVQIPEFSFQFMPLLFMLGLIVVIQRKRRGVSK